VTASTAVKNWRNPHLPGKQPGASQLKCFFTSRSTTLSIPHCSSRSLHPSHTSQVLWPHCTCWSIHGPQSSAQIQCGPLTLA